MSWSYSGDPNGSTKDAVRFLIQDTTTARQLVQDEEIEFAINQEMNHFMAAALICKTLVIRAGGVRRKRIADFDISYDPEMYRILANQLEARGMTYQMPYAGGISVADKLAVQSNPDNVAPKFAVGLDDNASAPQPADPPVSGTGNPITTL